MIYYNKFSSKHCKRLIKEIFNCNIIFSYRKSLTLTTPFSYLYTRYAYLLYEYKMGAVKVKGLPYLFAFLHYMTNNRLILNIKHIKRKQFRFL